MYEFGTVVLLALVLTKLVDLVRHIREMTPAARISLAMLLGVGLAWAMDYSVFAGFGITFRASWMSIVATGLVMGGIASVWHEVLDLLGSFARRSHDQAIEIERHIPRAA